MGQRMPDEPIEYGNNCSSCFALGKTPKYVYARFFLLEGCTYGWVPPCHPPPNDRLFKLTQTAISNCLWRYEQSGWKVDFRAWYPPISGAYLQLFDDDGYNYFSDQHTGCIDEGFVWTNGFLSCTGSSCAHSGIAVVTWTPQATELLEGLNITKAQNLFLELFPLANGDLVYKFCKRSELTNIKVLLSP